MAEEECIFNGQFFASEAPELIEKKEKAHQLSQDYNNLYEDQPEERKGVPHELLDGIGEGTWMLGPIHFHCGCHTRAGEGCFMNFSFAVQDDARVTIGDHCSFAPNVTIVTPMHPMPGSERRGVVF